MKCKFCSEEVKPVLSDTDIHRKHKTWTCVNCGVIKNQYVVDNEVLRTWVKE
jgi:uncharacterized Zn finger protein